MNEHFATLDSTNDQIKELLASTIVLKKRVLEESLKISVQAFAESLLIPQVQ